VWRYHRAEVIHHPRQCHTSDTLARGLPHEPRGFFAGRQKKRRAYYHEMARREEAEYPRPGLLRRDGADGSCLGCGKKGRAVSRGAANRPHITSANAGLCGSHRSYQLPLFRRQSATSPAATQRCPRRDRAARPGAVEQRPTRSQREQRTSRISMRAASSQRV